MSPEHSPHPNLQQTPNGEMIDNKYLDKIQKLEQRQDASDERQSELMEAQAQIPERYHEIARPAAIAGELAVRRFVSGRRERRIEKLAEKAAEKPEEKPKRMQGDAGMASFGRLGKSLRERSEIKQKRKNRKKAEKLMSRDAERKVKGVRAEKHNAPRGSYDALLLDMSRTGIEAGYAVDPAGQAATMLTDLSTGQMLAHVDSVAGVQLMKDNRVGVAPIEQGSALPIDKVGNSGKHARFGIMPAFINRYPEQGMILQQKRFMARALGLRPTGELVIHKGEEDYFVSESLKFPQHRLNVPSHENLVNAQNQGMSASGQEAIARQLSSNYLFRISNNNGEKDGEKKRDEMSKANFSEQALGVLNDILTKGGLTASTSEESSLEEFGFKMQLARSLGFDVPTWSVDDENKRIFVKISADNKFSRLGLEGKTDVYKGNAINHMAQILQASAKPAKSSLEAAAEQSFMSKIQKQRTEDYEREFAESQGYVYDQKSKRYYEKNDPRYLELLAERQKEDAGPEIADLSDIDDSYLAYFEESRLAVLQQHIANANRDEAHRRKDERGLDKLPPDEFAEIVRTNRTNLINSYLPDDAPDEVKARVNQALTNLYKKNQAAKQRGR